MRTPQLYSHLSSLIVNYSVYNSAQEGQDALIYRKMTTKVQVHNDGLCKWLSPYFSSTSCNIDSTDFPFDQQTCIVEMASWTQTGLQIDVNLGNVSIDTGSYQENIQWKLVSTDARKEVKYYTFTTEPYPSVVFEFVLRRRSLFYIINLIFPCVILSFLSLMTFYIPPASGERVTLSISLLLTMLFTLYIVTENLPPDSTTVPLLTKFVGVAMLVMTLSLFATSVGIKFEGKAEKMPKWMCLLVNKYLACLVLYDRSCLHDCTSPGGRSKGEAVFRRNSREDYQETLLQGHGKLEVSTAHPPKPQIIPDLNNQQTCRYRITETSRNRDAQESQPAEAGGPGRHDLILTDIANKFRRLSSRVQKKNAEEELEDEWKKAGVILNKFFFWTFLGVLLFSTIAIFSRAKYTE